MHFDGRLPRVCAALFKNKGPNAKFYLLHQEPTSRSDLFLSQKSYYPIGVDRTFNLGRFFVTALVYKNLRVVRANDADEHPLLLGPVFIHRDAIFEAYNYFLSTIKGSLHPQNSISSFDIRLEEGIYIGSDEERAIINAIDINFPGSNVIMLETFERWCVELQVGVPQKDRKKICDAIFGDKGAINADDSIDFERKSRKVLEKVCVCVSEICELFQEQVTTLHVNAPTRKSNVSTNWTNNKCESLNHILKLDANWKVKSTPDLINMLHEMTMLHFKDFKRALYGEGNYRLYGKYAKYSVPRSQWKSLISVDREANFPDFVKNKKCVKEDKNYVKSTYSDFKVPMLNVAKKPGQKSRLRKSKTKNLKKRVKDLRKKMWAF